MSTSPYTFLTPAGEIDALAVLKDAARQARRMLRQQDEPARVASRAMLNLRPETYGEIYRRVRNDHFAHAAVQRDLFREKQEFESLGSKERVIWSLRRDLERARSSFDSTPAQIDRLERQIEIAQQDVRCGAELEAA